jgi:hypothetical protein
MSEREERETRMLVFVVATRLQREGVESSIRKEDEKHHVCLEEWKRTEDMDP